MCVCNPIERYLRVLFTLKGTVWMALKKKRDNKKGRYKKRVENG